MERRLHPSTTAVTSGRPDSTPGQPVNQPIVATSTYHAEGAIEYGRDDNPSTSALERALADLEGGFATVFASGMAASNAILDLIPTGSRVLSPTNTYTGVAVRLSELAAQGHIELKLYDVVDTATLLGHLESTDVLWIESPTNPLLDVADLATILHAARATGILTIVDNTFATPVSQQPLSLGADYVVHSLTKMISGHSDLILGAVVSSDSEKHNLMRKRRTFLGAMPSPFDCYLALRGLRTLFIRFERAEHNAREIATRLARDSRVSRVRYPGWGTIVAIEVQGDADNVCRATEIWTYATSLGGVESLLERRRRWDAERGNVPENLIRLSLGIEFIEDLWSDLDQALAQA